MDGIYLGGSLLAAFVAGAVALFAPCCIVFMFPAYLAAAVRNRKWRLVPLTLVFTAGLAVVLVPVTLGIGLLTRPLLRFHGVIYAFGGVLLIAMAALSAVGRTWPLPMLKGSPDLQRTDSAGVFALGVFSGAASSCCAPVLAGVVTLSAVAPNLIQATGIGLAYVFGMAFPLLLVTLAWDRSTLAQRSLRGRSITWRIGSREFTTNSVSLLAAAAMAVMGLALLVVAATGSTIAPTAQVGIGNWIERTATSALAWLEPVPDWIVALGLVGIGIGAVTISGRRRAPQPDLTETEGVHRVHEHETAAAADRHDCCS